MPQGYREVAEHKVIRGDIMGNKSSGITVSSILRIIPGIIIRMDSSGRYIDVLTNEEEKLVLPREELLGKNISDVLPEKTAEKIRESLHQALSTMSVHVVEYELATPAGKFFFEAHIAPEKDKTLTAFVRDITSRKSSEKAAARHKEIINEYSQLTSLFDSMEHDIYVADMDTYEVLYVNKALEQKLSGSPLGKTCYKEFQGLDSPCGFCTNSKIRHNGNRPYYWEHYNAKFKAHFHLTDRVIKWPDGRDVRFEMAVDITQRKVLEEKLNIMAATDELTGLWNRRHFMREGKREFERSSRYKTIFSLLILDIDRFKRINDTFGHLAGDKAIRKIVGDIREGLREADIFGRIGGDEFGIILPHTDLSNATVLADRLRQNIALRPVSFGEHDSFVSVSMGATGYREDFKSFDDMLKVADYALYQAKSGGRNRIVDRS